MQINRNNCEAFFLDYYEGTLSEAQVGEMFAFLKANPDLREVFESFADVSVNTESTSVPDFSFLKKEPVADIHQQAEQWMVEMVDGTISGADRAALENYLDENPSKRADLAAFENTILRADENETFGDAFRLKKNVVITPENFEHFAIALIEGTISPEERSLLESFVLAHPEFQVELDAFRNAVQHVDESIIFDAKGSLKRTGLAVTKDNIEELLIAKFEGQLAAHDEQAVDAFVAAHPAYKKELELLAKSKLVADTAEVFEAKDQLKRGAVLINESNFEQYAVSAVEGLLNSEEQKALDAFAATQPKYGKTIALYAATRVQPDAAVVYANKAELKRKERGAIIWFMPSVRYAAAAVLVLLLGLYLWTKFGTDDQTIAPVASNDGKQELPVDIKQKDPAQDNVLPQNSTNNNVAQNGSSPDAGTKNARTGSQSQDNDPQQEEPVHREIPTMSNDYVPVTIVASHIPNNANDDVNFSDAFYSGLNNQQNAQAVADNDGYISPGQYVMRWMKNKIDGKDARSVNDNQDMYAWNEPPSRSQDENVDGMDITESAVNRVGQSMTNGKVAMEQRKDGAYLQLWNYEVRVRK